LPPDIVGVVIVLVTVIVIVIAYIKNTEQTKVGCYILNVNRTF